MAVLVRKVVNFESLDEFMHLRLAHENSWYYDKSGSILGNAAGCIHPGQQSRRKKMSEIPVEHCEREIARGNQRQECCQTQKPPINSVAIHSVKQEAHDQQRQKCERPEIGRGGMSQQKTPEPLHRTWLIAKSIFQVSQAGVDKIVADMFFRALSFGGEIYSGLGDF